MNKNMNFCSLRRDRARARRACAAELRKILRILHFVIEVLSKKTYKTLAKVSWIKDIRFF